MCRQYLHWIHLAPTFLGLLLLAAAQAQATQVEHEGSLPDGTAWLIRVPENWNGVLLRDLDFASNAGGDRYTALMDRGYAFAGLARHPLRLWQYDPQREIQNLQRVQKIFANRVRKPDRVLQYGCSGGGFDGLASAESFADDIDGAVVLAGHIPVWIMNSFLDGWFAMKALLAEAYEAEGLGSAEDLQIAHLPNAGAGRSFSGIQAAWRTAIRAAGKNPQGRARLALAFAIGQWSPWMAGASELPDPTDTRAMADAIAASAMRIAGHVGGTSRLMFENAASGQQLSGNEDVNYAVFYMNAAPAMKAVVEALYAEAGLDLSADLERINAEPRISHSDYALDFWSQPGRTVTGDLDVPVVRLHLLGDWAVPYSLMQGYETLVEEKGHAILYRQALVAGTGHCEFTPAESTLAVETLMARLDSGFWPDTTPEALKARAVELDLEANSRFIPFETWRVGCYNRAWTPAD